MLTSLAFLTSSFCGVTGDICGAFEALASSSKNKERDFLLISINTHKKRINESDDFLKKTYHFGTLHFLHPRPSVLFQ